MSCIEGLLEGVARDVQERVQSQLTGFFGGMIRGYLPQTWVFETEEGTASLTVDREGRVLAAAGALPSPDVTIVTTHAKLSAALRTRKRELVPEGPLTVTPHTQKGQTAFGFLRSRLGL